MSGVYPVYSVPAVGAPAGSWLGSV